MRPRDRAAWRTPGVRWADCALSSRRRWPRKPGRGRDGVGAVSGSVPWRSRARTCLIERRAKAAFNSMAFFAGPGPPHVRLALGPDVPAGAARGGNAAPALAPGLLWVTILFAGVLALDRSFQVEMERGGLDALRLYPGDRKAIYLGKLIANVTIMLIMEMLVCPFAASCTASISGDGCRARERRHPHHHGLRGDGHLYAALTANLRARQVLLPLLMFPVLIPVILAAVKATGSSSTATRWASWGRGRAPGRRRHLVLDDLPARLRVRARGMLGTTNTKRTGTETQCASAHAPGSSLTKPRSLHLR